MKHIRRASYALSTPATLAISKGGITITGGGASSFAGVSTCGSTLAAGANCAESITFTPKSLGTFSARLSAADDAVREPQSVTLSGTASKPAKAAAQ